MNAWHTTQKFRKNRTRHAPRDERPQAEREEYGPRLALVAGLCLLVVIPACAQPHGVECRDIPKNAIPAPPGTYVCQWTAAEATRAEADKFVFYQYEWQRDKAQLGPFGQRHAAQVAERLPCAPYPVVIEPSDDAALDESRRLVIHQTLACQGQNVLLERIVVGHSMAEPLYSQEAPAIARGMFTNQTGAGTTSGFGGGGALGGGISGGTGVGSGIGGGGIGVGGMSGGTTSFGGY
jgi:hypothetical protein